MQVLNKIVICLDLFDRILCNITCLLIKHITKYNQNLFIPSRSLFLSHSLSKGRCATPITQPTSRHCTCTPKASSAERLLASASRILKKTKNVFFSPEIGMRVRSVILLAGKMGRCIRVDKGSRTALLSILTYLS